MKGTTHVFIGGVVGSYIGFLEQDPLIAGVSIAAASLSALAPDLDTNSTFTNRITLNPERIHRILALVGILLIIAAFWPAQPYETWLLVTIGAALVIFPKKAISRKTLLLCTAFLIGGTGIYLDMQPALLTLSLFLILAAFSSHRGFTHSLFGLALWSYMCYEASLVLNMQVLLTAGAAGYASHLLTDTKLFLNKRGIKPLWIFLPKLEI
ncbi:metal-dependent hydrolase [Salsuginibacillus kocurii]|uniref:metal-dependent hydrolase n=1 Tax=Salsuginibacillus kocurii TaxID=427078 RepID=UPI00036E133E|nr:metal-dependent hydrolase [Salsuginibacillus kocurii]